MYGSSVYASEPNSGNVPAFLIKLWTLVEDHSTDDLIYWGQNGTSFHVQDQNRFSHEVLPRYFKHNNIASFIRQLNMYGFRKVVNVDQGALKLEKDDLEFYHVYFQQGQEHLLEHIKRKVSNNVKMESVKLKQEDVSKVLTDVRCMKGRQDGLTNKLDSLKRENEALWREVANLQQKHMKQQQIVNKVIQFLVTLVRGNRTFPDRKRKKPLMLNDTSHLAAKISKPNDQLSIGVPNDPYTVQSPKSIEGPNSANGQTSRGPIIHDITDSFLEDSNLLSVADVSKLSSSDLEELVSGDDKLITLPEEIISPASAISSCSPITPVCTDTTVTSVQPTFTTNTLESHSNVSSPDHNVQNELEVMQMDLDNLKDLFSGQYSIDPNLLMGIFTPDVPLSQTTENILDSLEKSADNSNSSNDPPKGDSSTNILGNELIQYQPPEELPNLFDFGDAVYDGDLNTDLFNSDSLMTPNFCLSTPTSKVSEVQPEEVD